MPRVCGAARKIQQARKERAEREKRDREERKQRERRDKEERRESEKREREARKERERREKEAQQVRHSGAIRAHILVMRACAHMTGNVRVCAGTAGGPAE